MNKKGVMWDDIKNAVLAALAIGVGIYLIWAFLLHGAGTSAGALQKCGALTGSKGECKELCNTATELTFENVGCTGVANKCCVRKAENMNDVILPSGYGGNSEYDFKVISIDFDSSLGLPAGCQPDSNVASKTIICTPNGRYSIPVVIQIKNVNRAVEVYADPVVVINGNGDNMKKLGTYVGKVPLKLDAITLTGEAKTTIEVGAGESTENDYWEVYPYAICITNECKKTDSSKSNGILSMNNNDLVTIKFIK